MVTVRVSLGKAGVGKGKSGKREVMVRVTVTAPLGAVTLPVPVHAFVTELAGTTFAFKVVTAVGYW